MLASFDLGAQQASAKHAVGDAVATVGQREQHAWTVLRMTAEQRQAVAGFSESAGPGKRRSCLQLRQEARDFALQSRSNLDASR